MPMIPVPRPALVASLAMIFAALTMLGAKETDAAPASYYAHEHEGLPTASGELYDPMDMTLAHPTLLFGTYVLVCNTANDLCVEGRVNDRGPFTGDRVADLSLGMMLAIDGVDAGVPDVTLEVL